MPKRLKMKTNSSGLNMMLININNSYGHTTTHLLSRKFEREGKGFASLLKLKIAKGQKVIQGCI